MWPHQTEMDLSISTALYFASRGSGTLETEDAAQSYETPAKILLSGLGADELLGGYSRHAKAFSSRGYEGLLDELDLDIRRISYRNLGRDDRVVSHSGREVRYPFLDERVIGLLLRTPIWHKCGFHRPADLEANDPGKILLRQVALHLGLRTAAQQRKRAIQFGARTAKMHAGKIKGRDLVSRP